MRALWTTVLLVELMLAQSSGAPGGLTPRPIRSVGNTPARLPGGLPTETTDLHDRPEGTRALKQQGEMVDVTVVTAPQQLIDAVLDGALHIEVQSHLDMTTVTPRDNVGELRMLNLDDTTFSDFGHSIRGNCDTEPSDFTLGLLEGTAGLGDWQAGQCVIVTDIRLMSIQQNFWIDNIFIRHHRTSRTESDIALWCGSKNCNLWMTNVTLQGDGKMDPSSGGIHVNGGQAYAERLKVMDFDSNFTALGVSGGATVTLNTFTMIRNAISDSFFNSGVISVGAVTGYNGTEEQDQDTILRLIEPDIWNNEATYDLVLSRGLEPFDEYDAFIFSDEEMDVYYDDYSGLVGTTLPLEDAPADRPGIDANSPWFVNLKEALPELKPVTAPPPSEAASASAGSDSAQATPFSVTEDGNFFENAAVPLLRYSTTGYRCILSGIATVMAVLVTSMLV